MTWVATFLIAVLGSITGTFLEIHFDLEGKYETYRYRKHQSKEHDGV